RTLEDGRRHQRADRRPADLCPEHRRAEAAADSRRVGRGEAVMSSSPLVDGSALSAEQEARLDRICDRFEDAWKAGVRPRLEDYLADVPDAERVAAARERLRVEAFSRRGAGEEPQPADFQVRLPLLTAQQISMALVVEAPTTQAVTRPASPSGPDAAPVRARA